jgi:hypothetical protein
MTDKTELQVLVDKMLKERLAVLAELKDALAYLPPEMRLFEVLKHLSDSEIQEVTSKIYLSKK